MDYMYTKGYLIYLSMLVILLLRVPFASAVQRKASTVESRVVSHLPRYLSTWGFRGRLKQYTCDQPAKQTIYLANADGRASSSQEGTLNVSMLCLYICFLPSQRGRSSAVHTRRHRQCIYISLKLVVMPLSL